MTEKSFSNTPAVGLSLTENHPQAERTGRTLLSGMSSFIIN